MYFSEAEILVRFALQPLILCPNFGQFRPTASRFQDTRSPKIGNAMNDPKLNVNAQTVKA